MNTNPRNLTTAGSKETDISNDGGFNFGSFGAIPSDAPTSYSTNDPVEFRVGEVVMEKKRYWLG